MKICVLVPAAEDATQAGTRIRYRRIEPALQALGHELQVSSIKDALGGKGRDHDAYVISKCYDARALLLAEHLARGGKLVGVDLFDDYFSQASDSRFAGQRYWLSALSHSVDFFLCSTTAMRDIARGLATDLPAHVMNDPAPPLDPEQVRQALRHKREQLYRTGILNVAWFGIGDNPSFPVGLTDLVAFGGELGKLGRGGLTARLSILTNERAMTAKSLALLRRLALPYTVEEWTERRESRLLAESLLCFLPVNAQSFSVVKSLNRAVTALHAGTQVLSSGYPLYGALQPFIYRSAESFLDDLARSRLALREDSVPELLHVFEQRADPGVEALSLVAFLGKLANRKSALAPVPGQQAAIAVVHGNTTTDGVHKFAQEMKALSVSSPYCRAALNFDVRFVLAPDHAGMDVLIAEQHCEGLAPQIQRQLARHGKIADTNYRKLDASAFPLRGGSDGTDLARMGSAMSIAASYPRMAARIEQVLQELFPGIRCYQSEYGPLPWRIAPRQETGVGALA